MATLTVRDVMERLLETPPLPSAQQALSIRRANAVYEASSCSAVDRDNAIAQMMLAHAPTRAHDSSVEPPDVDPSAHPIRIQLPKELFPGVHALLRSRSHSHTPITGRVDASLNIRIMESTADGARFEARRQPTRAFRAMQKEGGRALAIGPSIESVLIPVAKGRAKLKTHPNGFAPPTRNIATEFAYLESSEQKTALEVAMGGHRSDAQRASSCLPPPTHLAREDRSNAIRQDAFTLCDMFGDDNDDDYVNDCAIGQPDTTRLVTAVTDAAHAAHLAIGAFPRPQQPDARHVRARIDAAIVAARQRGACDGLSSSSSSAS